MSIRTRVHGRDVSARLAAGVLALVVSFASHVALADPVRVGAIAIHRPWSRATPPAAITGVGYLELANTSTADDRLVSANSPVANETQIHEMRVENGVMTMRQLIDGLVIPAGGDVVLKPGSYHVMLIDLKQPLKAGDDVPVTLTFEKAGKVDVALHVEKLGSPGPGGGAEEAMGGHVMEGMAQ
jgi:periplasmic copper chaperone A